MKDAELVDRFRDESDIEKWMDHVRQEAKRLFSSQKGQEDHVHSNHRSPDDLDMNKHNPQPLRDVSKVLFPEDAYPSPQPISFAHRIQDGIPESTSPAFNANAELLSLESDFQARLLRFQDDQSLDYAHITNLKNPLEHLLDLFMSFEAPPSALGTSTSPQHIESTLRVLSQLLTSYDQTLAILHKARDTVGRIESNHILQQQRVSEWGNTVTKEMHRVRGWIQRSAEREGYLETERDILRRKVTSLERDKKQNENLILEMAKKINEADERAFKLERENKKNASRVLSLQSQIAGIKRLKSHFVDLGLVKDDPELKAMIKRAPFDPLKLRSSHSSMDLESRPVYSTAKERVRQYMNDVDFKKNENGTVKPTRSRSKSKSTTRKGRSKSRGRSGSRTRSASVTTTNSSCVSTPTTRSRQDDYSRGRPVYKYSSTQVTSAHSPRIVQKPNSKLDLGRLPPAKAVLLAKLEDVDHEIDALAKELMLY